MAFSHYTKTRALNGRIKQRISDFVVEEVFDGRECKAKCFTDSEKKDTKKNWDLGEEKEFLHLEMEKFNYDTIQAIKRITRSLGVSQKRIGYAGMKDKRAISCQRISIWKPDLEKLKEFKSRYIDIRPIEWSEKRIELGDLKENKFTVRIRDIELEKKEVEEVLKEFGIEAEKGIPAFFGEQRFGGERKVTHLVGREIVKGDLEKAVMLYLCKESEKEEEETRKSRRDLFEGRDFARAVREFPSKLKYERIMLHYLCKKPKDFAGALNALPKGIKHLFVHAFQSHLYNKQLEKRMHEGNGLEEIEGDILEEEIPTACLYGFESVLASGRQGEIERKVLEEEGIELKDFKTKIGEMSSKGKRKKIVLKAKNFKVLKVEEDELNEGKRSVVLEFFLEKGEYATTVLRELMKGKE